MADTEVVVQHQNILPEVFPVLLSPGIIALEWGYSIDFAIAD
jgi:hypothetical protein